MSVNYDVAVIDYGMGNLHSVEKALKKVSPDSSVYVGSEAEVILSAHRVVYPGVGAIRDCIGEIKRLGLDEIIVESARRVPLLGICVGMQLMATASQEHGRHSGLGWIAGDVVPLALDNPALKIPHMGWNDLILHKPHPVIAGVENGEHVYFVHSYHFVVSDPEYLIATADYGGRQTAIVARDNMIGTQFHPEKSQATGLRMIENFLSWRP